MGPALLVGGTFGAGGHAPEVQEEGEGEEAEEGRDKASSARPPAPPPPSSASAPSMPPCHGTVTVMPTWQQEKELGQVQGGGWQGGASHRKWGGGKVGRRGGSWEGGKGEGGDLELEYWAGRCSSLGHVVLVLREGVSLRRSGSRLQGSTPTLTPTLTLTLTLIHTLTLTLTLVTILHLTPSQGTTATRTRGSPLYRTGKRPQVLPGQQPTALLHSRTVTRGGHTVTRGSGQ